MPYYNVSVLTIPNPAKHNVTRRQEAPTIRCPFISTSNHIGFQDHDAGAFRTTSSPLAAYICNISALHLKVPSYVTVAPRESLSLTLNISWCLVWEVHMHHIS